MLPEYFMYVGALILLAGWSRYLIDTLSGKVRPNKVSYFLWAVGPLIAFAAQYTQGVGIQSLITFMAGFITLLIFFASFVNKKAYWKLTSFDLANGALAVMGLALWYVTRVGNVAIFFTILADIFASIPTIVKSYYYPETESPFPYLSSVIYAGITLLTIDIWSFAHYGFPVYYLCVNFIIFISIRLGKKRD